MPRKKQKPREFSETESAEPESESMRAAPAEEEAISTEEPRISDDAEEVPSDSEASATEDDLLAEVRQSLIEQESREQEKQPTLWKRVSRGLKKSKKAGAQKAPPEEPQRPPEVEPVVPTQLEVKQDSDVGLSQLDELVDLLETSQDKPSAEIVEETPQKEVAEINLDELKKQAFQPRTDDEIAEELSEVRSIVLEGGEEVFVEVESKPQDAAGDRTEAFLNALRPYRTYIYFVIAFVGFIAVVISGLILFNVVRQYLPTTQPEVVADLPYPVGISLPGGINFNLNRGELVNGQWNPTGPEWLAGTEICRWVAIPWSLQMETVLRTLNSKDLIELSMSNNDQLTYHVYTVREVSVDELQELDTDTPCLHLVLAKADSETRWVLTALP
jgi:hypothetical protein